MTQIFLGLGSNIEPRNFYLDSAVFFLDVLGINSITESSRIETDPIGFLEQPKFINSVVRAETNLSPQLLIRFCLIIEKIIGRVRTQKNGPRTIDIDVLLFGDQVIDTPELIIPHPQMHLRNFVLQPLVQLEPNLIHPCFKKPVSQLLKDLNDGSRID